MATAFAEISPHRGMLMADAVREIDFCDAELARDEMRDLVWTVVHSRLSKGDLAWAMGREHRTEQQVFGGFVLALITHWAEEQAEGRHDARNEAICSVAGKIVERMGDDWPDCGLPYI